MVVTKRSVKGSALTFAEMDANWDDAGVPGAWAVLEEQTASGTANLNFDQDTTTYKNFRYWGANLLPALDDKHIVVVVSIDGGSSYIGGGYQWAAVGMHVGVAFDNHNSYSTGNWVLTCRSGEGQGNDTPGGGNFVLETMSHVNEKNWGFVYQGAYEGQSSYTVISNGGGLNITGGGDVDNIKFAYESGNIASGTILQEGQRI